MTNPYEDIILLPHPVSPRRRHMTISERAAQFAPFAALSGFSSAIAEAGKQSYAAEDFPQNHRKKQSAFEAIEKSRFWIYNGGHINDKEGFL